MSNLGFALPELQAAVFAALSNDQGVTAAIGGSGKIFDYVPEGTLFPYVTIGDSQANEWASQTFDGEEHTLSVHTWTRTHGRAFAQGVMKQIYRVLHLARLPMQTQRMVLMRHEFATVMLDPDGLTFHGVQRFRILTQGV